MKIAEILILVEALKKTEKASISQNAYDLLLPLKDDATVFIRFTNDDILEVNEKTKHTDTPAGLYTYRLKNIWKKYKVEENKSFIDLPFAAQSKYIQVFKYSGKKAPIISSDKSYTPAMLNKDVKKLKLKYDNYDEKISGLKLKKLPGSQLLSITEKLEPNFLKWSELLMYLGYEGLIDDGKKVIHPDEPQQAVFFKPEYLKQAIKGVWTIENKSEFNQSKSETNDNAAEGFIIGEVTIPGVEKYQLEISPLSMETETDNLDDALKYCERLNWELPNTNDMQAIIKNKSIVPNAFKFNNAMYWTFLEILSDKMPYICNVYKGGMGSANSKKEMYRVRPVRRIRK